MGVAIAFVLFVLPWLLVGAAVAHAAITRTPSLLDPNFGCGSSEFEQAGKGPTMPWETR